jgi:plasmid stability protein
MCSLSDLQDKKGAADTSAKVCYRLAASDLQSVNSVDIMANLLIRNFDEALRDRLQGRARAKHRSLAEEAHEALRIAAGGPTLKPVPKTVAPDASKAITLFVMVVAVLYFGPDGFDSRYDRITSDIFAGAAGGSFSEGASRAGAIGAA